LGKFFRVRGGAGFGRLIARALGPQGRSFYPGGTPYCRPWYRSFPTSKAPLCRGRGTPLLLKRGGFPGGQNLSPPRGTVSSSQNSFFLGKRFEKNEKKKDNGNVRAHRPNLQGFGVYVFTFWRGDQGELEKQGAHIPRGKKRGGGPRFRKERGGKIGFPRSEFPALSPVHRRASSGRKPTAMGGGLWTAGAVCFAFWQKN